MTSRLLVILVAFVGVLVGTAFADEGTTHSEAGSKAAGWQLEAHLPSNMSPALSWDCMDFPQQADRFARAYIDQIWMQAGCKITKAISGDSDFASAAIECPFGTRQFQFRKTSYSTLGINEIEVDSGGARNQSLMLLKQCDASIEFDCTEQGKAAWRATRPPQAINYSCEESSPPPIEPTGVSEKPDFGFPVK